MTDRHQEPSDEAVRRALRDVAAASRHAPDLADRLIANARAGGPAVVHLAARRHTRWAAPLLAAAVVAALALGGVAIGSTLADKRQPSSTQLPSIVAPSSLDAPTASPAPPTSPAPSLRRTKTPSATPTRTDTKSKAPAGVRLTVAMLDNATIDMPSWGKIDGGDRCRSGERRFHNGRNTLESNEPASQSYMEFQGAKAVGDVDGDGVTDVAAVVFCGIHQAIGERVLAFRATAAGRIEVIGDVVAPISYFGGSPQGLPQSVTGGRAGSVTVHWNDGFQVDDPVQDRTYRLTGGRFVQVAGLTKFEQTTDISVTPRAPVPGKPKGYQYSVRVTVRNNGARSDSVELFLRGRALRVARATLDGRDVPLDASGHAYTGYLGEISSGRSVSVRIVITMGNGAKQPSLAVRAAPENRSDPDSANNAAQVPFPAP